MLSAGVRARLPDEWQHGEGRGQEQVQTHGITIQLRSCTTGAGGKGTPGVSFSAAAQVGEGPTGQAVRLTGIQEERQHGRDHDHPGHPAPTHTPSTPQVVLWDMTPLHGFQSAASHASHTYCVA